MKDKLPKTLEEALIMLINNKQYNNLNEKKMLRKGMLTPHISIKECYYSYKAKRLGIDNRPSKAQFTKLKKLGLLLFEPIRDNFGVMIKINSMYRCLFLNIKVGGSYRSQHVKCEAMDIDDTYGRVTNSEMFYFVVENLDFDQLIWEFGDIDNPSWIHISSKVDNTKDNRHMLLISYIENDEKKYKSFKSIESFNNFKYKLYA